MNKNNKLHTLKRLLILIAPSIFVSCVSLNSHQTGRTVGKNNISIFGNFNFGHIDSIQFTSLGNSETFYISEIGAYGGIKDNFDVGIKANTSLQLTGMSKYQFIGDEKSLFASSFGFDIGTSPLLSLVFGGLGYSGTLSLFNSIHPTDYIAITLSPRYSHYGFANLSEYKYRRKDNIYGYSAGIIIGKKNKFSVEFSQYSNNIKFTFYTKPIFSLGYIRSL